MYAIVWWVEVVFVAAAVVSISLVPAADPAPLSLSDRVTRWHFIELRSSVDQIAANSAPQESEANGDKDVLEKKMSVKFQLWSQW